MQPQTSGMTSSWETVVPNGSPTPQKNGMCNPDNRNRFHRTRCRRVLLAQVLAERLLSPESPPALFVLVGARLVVAVLVLVLIVAVWFVLVIVLLA